MTSDIPAIRDRPDLPSYLSTIFSRYFGLARDDAGRPLAYDMDSALSDLGIEGRTTRSDIKELWRSMAAEDSAIEADKYKRDERTRESSADGAVQAARAGVRRAARAPARAG